MSTHPFDLEQLVGCGEGFVGDEVIGQELAAEPVDDLLVAPVAEVRALPARQLLECLAADAGVDTAVDVRVPGVLSVEVACRDQQDQLTQAEVEARLEAGIGAERLDPVAQLRAVQPAQGAGPRVPPRLPEMRSDSSCWRGVIVSGVSFGSRTGSSISIS